MSRILLQCQGPGMLPRTCPIFHRPCSALTFEPCFAAVLPPWGTSLLHCEDMLFYRPYRLCGRFDALEVFAKRTAGCFYRLFCALFFVFPIELLHLTCLMLFLSSRHDFTYLKGPL